MLKRASAASPYLFFELSFFILLCYHQHGIVDLNYLAKIAVLVATSTLIACAPNTHNQPISISIPNYLNDPNHSRELNQLPYRAWWKDFGDHQLNHLIDKALHCNNDVNIAKQNIRVALAELQTIRLNWLPGLNVLMGFSQNPALGNPGLFYGALPSYYLNFFTLYFQQKTAEFTLLRAKAYALGVRLTVIGEVAGSYFSLLAWHHQLDLLRQIEKDNSVLVASLSVAKTQGLANNQQVLTIKSQLQTVRGLQKQVQNNLVAAENALRYLTNEPPGPIKLNNSFIDLPSNAAPLSKINVQVVTHRPDVMVAWYALRGACSGVNVSETRLLPSMTLDYFAGNASLNGSFKSPTHWAPYSDAYATFNLSPSLFGTILTSKAIFNKRLAEYNNIIQSALRLIANSIVANQKFMEKYNDDRHSFDSLIKRYQLQQDLYRKGLISHNDLLYNRIEINQVDFKLTISKLKQLLNVINLYQELAAGIHYHQHQPIKRNQHG